MPSKPFVVRSRSVLVGITDSQFVGFATAVSANVKWIAAALSDTTVAAVIRLEGTQGNLRFMRMANTEAKQFELTVDICWKKNYSQTGRHTIFRSPPTKMFLSPAPSATSKQSDQPGFGKSHPRLLKSNQ